jgi:hypothetical protein
LDGDFLFMILRWFAGGCIYTSIGAGTMDPNDERNKLFEDWVKQQLHISDEKAHTALYGDAEGNPLPKKLTSRPFSPQDDLASLERFRKWPVGFLEHSLEMSRHKLYAIQGNYSDLDPQFRPDVGQIRSLQRRIRLIEQVLDEREAIESNAVASPAKTEERYSNSAPAISAEPNGEHPLPREANTNNATSAVATSAPQAKRNGKRGPKPITKAEALFVAKVIERTGPDWRSKLEDVGFALTHGICDASDPEMCDISDHKKVTLPRGWEAKKHNWMSPPDEALLIKAIEQRLKRAREFA